MALDYRATQQLQQPEIDDPSLAYARALANKRGEQILDEGAFVAEDARYKAQQALEQRQKDAQVSQILAQSASPYDAVEAVYRVDQKKAHDLAAQNADAAMRMIQGVSNYQALGSVWPTIQKYVGPQEAPQFQNEEEFGQWKRQQALAHVDAKTYLEQTKPATPKASEQGFTLSPGQVRYGPDGATLATAPAAEKTPTAAQGFTLAPGGRRFDASGKLIATAPDRPQAAGGAKPTQREQDVDALAQTVIENPALFDQLTPTDRGRIAPKLRALGFDGFGKPLPPAAVKQISDTKTAIDSLKDLKTVLKDNEQYIGPIAGFQALNPYSAARQAQARIDLVRQRVGKALEGGVLRKEDEEKYKLILATLRDTPATAVYKVDSLIHSLEQDVDNFVGQQRLSGRRVSQEQADSVKSGGSFTVQAPNGKTYSFKSKADADAFKTRAGIK